jgi:hypothetical protein
MITPDRTVSAALFHDAGGRYDLFGEHAALGVKQAP